MPGYNNSIHIALSLKAQATLHFTRTTTPGVRDRKIVTIYYTVLMSYFIIFAFHLTTINTCIVRAYVGVDLDLLPPGGSLIVQCSSVGE